MYSEDCYGHSRLSSGLLQVDCYADCHADCYTWTVTSGLSCRLSYGLSCGLSCGLLQVDCYDIILGVVKLTEMCYNTVLQYSVGCIQG